MARSLGQDQPDPADLAAIGMSADEFEAMYQRATEAAENDPAPVAVAVRYDQPTKRIVVDLSNGTTFIFPARMGQGLAGATDEQLADVQVSPAGWGLHWPQLDADLSVAGVLQGSFGGKAWMAQLRSEMARQAGKATSEAKAAAARANGKKGGRPRKHHA